jgi:aryl sulfotransferase
MNERVWLASYPKSGNTWFRVLIGCLALKDGEAVDVNMTAAKGGIASARMPFDLTTLIDSDLLTADEIDRLRPRVYEALAQSLEEEPEEAGETPALEFVKTHDAYTMTSAGEPLLAGARGAKAAILIVRDPRDIVASLANHNQSTLDEAIGVMNDPDAALCAKSDRVHKQFRQIMLSWSGYVESWLDQPDIPVHLVRYEAMKRDTAATFAEAMAFAGQPISLEEAARAARLADFSELQAQERERGFGEKPPRTEAFFRKGQTGAWRDELTPEQVECIEAAHAPMMARLGYELSLKLAPAGKLERAG